MCGPTNGKSRVRIFTRVVRRLLTMSRPHTPVHAEVLQQLLKDAPDSLFRLVGRTLKRVAALPVDEETAKARSDLVKTLEAKLPGSQPRTKCR